MNQVSLGDLVFSCHQKHANRVNFHHCTTYKDTALYLKMAKARESVLLCRSVKMNTNINGYHLSAGQMLPVLARPGLLDLRKCEGSGR